MSNTLNPSLYAALRDADRAGLRGGGFGGREVRIANAGATKVAAVSGTSAAVCGCSGP